MASTSTPPTDRPNIQRLAEALQQMEQAEFTIAIDLPDKSFELTLCRSRYNSHHITIRHGHGKKVEGYDSAPNLETAMIEKTRCWSSGKIRPETVQVRTGKVARNKELKPLVRAAWCEAFGIEPPTAEQLVKLEAKYQEELVGQRVALAQDLCGGPEGITRWNARPQWERSSAKLRRAYLSGADLSQANLRELDLQHASFLAAQLNQANLAFGKCQNACFDRASLSQSNASGASFREASFQGAVLSRCNFRSANLRQAKLQQADLSEADLRHANLRGADLSDAVLTGIQLEGVQYDETTRFPNGFLVSRLMRWAGKGSNPHLPGASAGPLEPIELEGFLAKLREEAHGPSLNRALYVLKKERFTLFTQAKDDGLIGVIRSHATPNLVYACRIGPGGEFGCCTHYLHACQAMSGRLCPHLLVLLIGLAQAGQLDLARTRRWVEDCNLMQPTVDREKLSEVLLRYKGAEASEIDWRPTETVPEDFYAF